MAWVIEQKLKCVNCGTRREEWDPKRGGHFQAYTAITDMCQGCRISEEAFTSVHKDNPKAHGIKVHLEPTVNHPYFVPTLKPTKDRTF